MTLEELGKAEGAIRSVLSLKNITAIYRAAMNGDLAAFRLILLTVRNRAESTIRWPWYEGTGGFCTRARGWKKDKRLYCTPGFGLGKCAYLPNPTMRSTTKGCGKRC